MSTLEKGFIDRFSGTAKVLRIGFGSFARPLRDQLAEQGRRLERQYLGQFQFECDCVVALYVGGKITSAEAKRVRLRIMRAIGDLSVPLKNRKEGAR